MTGVWIAAGALAAALVLLTVIAICLYVTRDRGTRAAPREPSRWQRVRAHRWRIGDAWDRATARAGHTWRRALTRAAVGTGRWHRAIDPIERYRRRYLTPADAHTAALFERMNGHHETPRVLAITQAITASRVYLAVMLRSAQADDGRWPHLRRQWSDDTGSFPALIDGGA